MLRELTKKTACSPNWSFCLFLLLLLSYTKYPLNEQRILPIHVAGALDRCRSLDLKPGPPPGFHERVVSDRFEVGTRPTLLLNAKVWTGDNNGTDVIDADIFLNKGIIKSIGRAARLLAETISGDIVVHDLNGSWVTPGLVDMHSHLGDAPSPELEGAIDDNSLKGPILPWLRALDGLNTHDDSFALSISGGITTSLILPGSANAIGGQGFPIKLRKTSERSSSSMLLEPPLTINNSFNDHGHPVNWRHMKHACGENPSRVYSNTRMDTIWAFRDAYSKAQQLRISQDEYCTKAKSGQLDNLGEFPEDLRWEALSEVLRGRVKVQIHCYETVDLDGLVRISNEFEFPIAAFHHAHEAYLVPDLLKKAYGKPPGVAIFSTNSRYKREAYRGSEYAPRILAAEGIEVAMKSDHPVTNSRYLLFEAQNAFYYGLPENLAIASVTSTPAKLLGIDHRVGYIKEGWDADLVVFDSHPLSLGATPTQVFIDGIPQLESPHIVPKSEFFQKTPHVPNFDEEAKQAIEYEGLPPILPGKYIEEDVLFVNVKEMFNGVGTNMESISLSSGGRYGSVLVRNGRIVCSGDVDLCSAISSGTSDFEVIDLCGGSLSPGLLSFGAPLGLQEIEAEPSTSDGEVFDPLTDTIPKLFMGDEGLVSAVDGLQFGGRDALYAYRSGVVVAVTAPLSSGFLSGLGTAISTNALHKLEDGAIIQDITALHVNIGYSGSFSMSTQIAALRRLLLESTPGGGFEQVAQGKIPLVVQTHSADVIATLCLLKKEVEGKIGVPMQLTVVGASEAHLLAKELHEADIGVILIPVRPFPATWDSRRILPGPPLTAHTGVSTLLTHNVTVGVGVRESWEARNTRFDIGWAALEANGTITKAEAIALGSINLYKLLGVRVENTELVATKGGGLLEYEGKVVAVVSPRRERVDLL